MTDHVKLNPRAFSGGDSAPGPEPPVVQLNYGGAPLRLYATTTFERKYRARAGDREPWTVQWLEESIKPGDVVFDIGANVGPFSLIAATRVGAAGRVYAFEPGYASFARLCDNIVLNELDDRIVPVPMPLAAATGLVNFVYRSVHAGQSRHVMQSPSAEPTGRRTQFRQSSFAFRLDDLARLFDLPPANHVKLDVDGAEVQVLEGFGSLLNAPTLQTLLVEIDRGLTSQVVDLLHAHSFDLSSRFERNQDTPCWYGLFRRTTS